jgi:hypothetical protein
MINYEALRRAFPGICFYIPQGADEPTSEDIDFWADYLSSGGESGSTGSTEYRADTVAKASLRGKPAKVGPRISIFDPELMAMIGMEL